MIPIEHIHDLVIFNSVVREGSFSGAAYSLGMTQPAVSLAIARLERQLGTTLFDRQRSGGDDGFVTSTGIILAEHAGRALAELERGVDAITEAEGRRPIRIGLPPIVTHHFFPNGLDVLAEAYGSHPVEVLSCGSERMLHEVEHHKLDVGMIASEGGSVSLPRVRVSKVATFPFLVAVPSAMASELGDQIDVEGVKRLGLPVISYTGDYVQREALASAFERRGHILNVAAETDQPQMMARLVEAGMGIGIATSISFDEDDAGLCLLPLVGKDVPQFNVFVFEDIARTVRPEIEVVSAIKRCLLEATRAA